MQKQKGLGGLLTVARYLSLDVVLGALGSATFMIWALSARIGLPLLLLLALATWTVYTLDHLVDARRIPAPALNPRHRYFQVHFKVLFRVWLVIGVATAALAIVLGMRNTNLFVLGGWATLLVILHIAVVLLASNRQGPFLQKEFAVAFIYTYGIAIPALLGIRARLSWDAAILLGQFVVLAWMNLLVYARFEYATDTTDGHTSTVQWLGVPATDVLVSVLVAVNLCASVGLVLLGKGQMLLGPVALLGLLSFLEGVTILAPAYFARHNRYRAWGEAVFMVPLLLWLVWLL
jgi:hypothetical protein